MTDLKEVFLSTTFHHYPGLHNRCSSVPCRTNSALLFLCLKIKLLKLQCIVINTEPQVIFDNFTFQVITCFFSKVDGKSSLRSISNLNCCFNLVSRNEARPHSHATRKAVWFSMTTMCDSIDSQTIVCESKTETENQHGGSKSATSYPRPQQVLQTDVINPWLWPWYRAPIMGKLCSHYG